MLFNSIDFVIFLPIIFILYWFVLNKNLRFQNLLVVFASYVFYGWWDLRFLSLILFSTIVDYLVGRGLMKEETLIKRRALLWTSILVNLGFLGFFKYYNFFADSFASAFTFMGYQINPQGLNIILPIGISFYTFQTLSYSMDVYKRKMVPTKDFVSFAAFVSFFPQLVAGPVERAKNLLPQFYTKRTFSYKSFSYGMKLIFWGFFLKCVVADRVAIYVNAVYNNAEHHEGLTFIAATILFSFQVYGDFSGYSLIAIGTAKLFGFDLMTNFVRPYFSSSLGEFWKRWHISLSTWFRDYLYISLGGSRVKKSRWLLNIFITFVVSGLWHGANWTFIAWGALHGIFLIIEFMFFKNIRKNVLNMFLTFTAVNFAAIFFRATSLDQGFFIVKTIFTNPGELFIGSGTDITASVYSALAVTILLLVEAKKEFFDSLFSISKNKFELVRISGYALLLFIIFYLGVFGENQFIYFQF